MTAAGGGPAGGSGGSGGAPEGYESVIGLEVHCELLTATKLFCGCRNAFGDEPNTNICPVCLGLPGSLPALNRNAVDLAMRIGTALGCEIRPSLFHRKNYFYPDMPKDYQISQYDEPINVDGRLELPDGSVVGIERAHLEEDTGKTGHAGGGGRIHDADYALIDYNRAGVPLVEIVSRPDIRTAEQARLYASELRAILVASGASDGRMEEGSMRVDANVSVRRVGATEFGTRCEVKNLNSLRSLGRAIDFEVARQVELLEAGGSVVQQTRHWDEERGETVALRSKEEAFDYRYFPEPDLVPLAPDAEWRARVAAALGPMPAARRTRLRSMLDGDATAAAEDQIATVVAEQLDPLVDAAVAAGTPAALAIARAANDAAADADAARRTDPAAYAALVLMEHSGALSATQAKKVLKALIADGGEPKSIAQAMGFEQLEAGAVASMVAAAVAANPDEWARYHDGEDELAQFFIGQVMRESKGRADGKAVVQELRRLRG